MLFRSKTAIQTELAMQWLEIFRIEIQSHKTSILDTKVGIIPISVFCTLLSINIQTISAMITVLSNGIMHPPCGQKVQNCKMTLWVTCRTAKAKADRGQKPYWQGLKIIKKYLIWNFKPKWRVYCCTLLIQYSRSRIHFFLVDQIHDFFHSSIPLFLFEILDFFSNKHLF